MEVRFTELGKDEPAEGTAVIDWVQRNVYEPGANSLIQLKNGVADATNGVSTALGGATLLGKTDYYEIEAPRNAAEFVTQAVSGGIGQIAPYLLAGKLASGALRSTMPAAVWENSLSRGAGRMFGIGNAGGSEWLRQTTSAVVGAACVDFLKEPLHNESRVANALSGSSAFITFGVLNPLMAKYHNSTFERISSRMTVGALGGLAQYGTASLIDGREISISTAGKVALSGATINTFLPPLMHETSVLMDAGRAGWQNRFTTKGSDSPTKTSSSGNRSSLDPSAVDVYMESRYQSKPKALPYYPEPGIEHLNLGPKLEQINPETVYRANLHSLQDSVRDLLPENRTEPVDQKLSYYLNEPGKIGEFMDAVRDKIKQLEVTDRASEAQKLRQQWESLRHQIPKDLIESPQQHKPLGPEKEWIKPDAGNTEQSAQPEWDPAWGKRPGEADESSWQPPEPVEPRLEYNPNEEPPSFHDLGHKEVGPPLEWRLPEESYKEPLHCLSEEVRALLPEKPTELIDLRLKTFINDPKYIGEFMDAVREKIDRLNLEKKFDEADVLDFYLKQLEIQLPKDFFNKDPEHRPLGPEQEWIKKPKDPPGEDSNWRPEWGERPDS